MSLFKKTKHKSASNAYPYFSKNNIAITTRYVRLKVTTAEGVASTVDIIIQGK